jgi:hypothetical protein
MRLLAAALALALGAGALLLPGTAAGRPDAPGPGAPVPVAAAAPDPGPPQPGTDDEAREYRQREAQSPEVAEFTGGHVGLFPVIVVCGIVLLLAYLLFEKKP